MAWSIQIRGNEVPAEVELTARKHGLGTRSSLPFLHSSASGLPLYQRMGFVTEESWTLFLP
ncbi:hypothetical protein ACQPZX_12040 [Actinoplanes sp. CA-142083]|uniref:hypothetical protein n=1 Tax=Actinoplanes sp. CA-142083 TaxID=3239903 RepID=UPI003D8AD7D7